MVELYGDGCAISGNGDDDPPPQQEGVSENTLLGEPIQKAIILIVCWPGCTIASLTSNASCTISSHVFAKVFALVYVHFGWAENHVSAIKISNS